jgi:hypothetical protein
VVSSTLSRFLTMYPDTELDWTVLNYFKEQIDEHEKTAFISLITEPDRVKSETISPSFDLIITNSNLDEVEEKNQLDEECERILASDRICYILRFNDTQYYIGSTLAHLKSRLAFHYQNKPPFTIYDLIEVTPNFQISSRTIETAIHCVCSEHLKVSIQSLESITSNTTGFNVEFSTANGINIVLKSLLLSETYNLKGKIRFIDDKIIRLVSNNLSDA